MASTSIRGTILLRKTLLLSLIPKEKCLPRRALGTSSEVHSFTRNTLLPRLLPSKYCFSTTTANNNNDDNNKKNDGQQRHSEAGPISSSCSTVTTTEEDVGVSVTVNPPSSSDIQIPGAQASSRKLAIVFTCTVCNTRSAKQFSESAYRKGVVIVQCPGCQNRHLIADRLGMFQDGNNFDVDTIAAMTGQSVTKISAGGDMELKLEDFIGSDKMKDILRAAGVEPSPPNTTKDPN